MRARSKGTFTLAGEVHLDTSVATVTALMRSIYWAAEKSIEEMKKDKSFNESIPQYRDQLAVMEWCKAAGNGIKEANRENWKHIQ